jgi:ATP-GRASP peptide maturase of grasp-with-spasm system
MILILSSPSEYSTNRVTEWIDKLGGRYIRLNDTLLYNFHTTFECSFIDGKEDFLIGTPDKSFALSEIHIVWFRRWTNKDYMRGLFSLSERKEWASNLVHHLSRETSTAGQFFLHLLRDKRWLDPPAAARDIKKHEVLSMAREEGLDTPNTLVTNHKERVLAFLKQQGRIITKPLSEITFFNSSEFEFLCYTHEVTEADLLPLADWFYPSLFQELIDKRMEIRTFYLDGQCYSMGIFSQQDEQTRIDFRNYDPSRPSRMIPYRLPDRITASIDRLMRRLNLSTGSVDLIRSTDGRYYFLEVNPVGQFGMTSGPCNYPLEKRIAQYLIDHDR